MEPATESAPEDSVSGTAASGTAASGTAASGNVTHDAAPGNTAPGNTAPGNVTHDDSANSDVTHRDVTRDDPARGGPRADRPLVFAHRGASAVLPEHTLDAYLRALADGADGVECDVRLTRDGHLVCLHDRRLDRTSNGQGRVSAHTLEELAQLDFGSWRGAGPARLLTLDQLLHTLRESAGAVGRADRPVELLVETKHPSRYGPHVERRLVSLLHHHGLTDPAPDDPVRVKVMSFSALAVRRIRQLAPALPTVLLLELLPPGLRIGRLPFGTRIAGPGVNLVRSRPALIPALRAAGNEIYVWTVNDPADLTLVERQGVDGIITDHPAATLAALGRS